VVVVEEVEEYTEEHLDAQFEFAGTVFFSSSEKDISRSPMREGVG